MTRPLSAAAARAATAAIGLLAALLGAAPAHAQATDISLAAPDPAHGPLSCLQQPAEPLDYPDEARRLQLGGTVRIAMTFSRPDAAPEVEVLARFASDRLVNAARERVATYRLPCQTAGQAPVRAIQTFVFRPQASVPVHWTRPAEEQDPALLASLRACLRTPAEHVKVGASKFDPRVGNAFLKLTFTAPDQPPAIETLYASTSGNTLEAMAAHANAYRLPCLPADSRPVSFVQHFVFRSHDAGRASFKEEVTLRDFLSNIKGIREREADFDFDTMSCPFTVAWRLGLPAVPNNVGEIGGHDRNRTDFLAWLATLEMDLKPDRFERLLGRTVKIEVPCGHLRLAPQQAALAQPAS